MLGLGAGVAISLLPIVAIIIVLATPRGRLNGVLFAVGWVVGLAAVGGVVLAFAGPAGASTKGQPAAWEGVVKLALGVLLVLFGARQWRRRPVHASQEAQLPKWMAAIDRFTPKILGLGLALAAANAKNVPLTIAAAASIGSAGLPVGQQIASLAHRCDGGPVLRARDEAARGRRASNALPRPNFPVTALSRLRSELRGRPD